MTKLPVLSGEQIIQKLKGIGYEVSRQRGSHVRLKHLMGARDPLTVPLHDEISPGLLKAILRQAKTTIEELASS